MGRKLVSFYALAWRGALGLLTLEVAIISALRYFTHSQAAPSVITDNAFANPFLIVHVTAGLAALILGPVQFVRRIRTFSPAMHRASGRVYVTACAIGAPAGFMLALGTTSGPVAAVGFAIPAVLWPIFTFLGLRAAIGRKIEHRDWMLRSYAITSNAITLRLMLPIAGALEIPFSSAYPVIAWLSWITNLALFELYIHRHQLSIASEPRLVAA